MEEIGSAKKAPLSEARHDLENSVNRLSVSFMAAALMLFAASPARAAETSPVITPNVFTPGSTPSLQVDFTVTSAVSLDPGRSVWDIGVGFGGVSIAGDLYVAAQVDLVTGVITCDFGGGISGSFTSTDLAALDVYWCHLFVDPVSSPTQGWVYFAVNFSDPLSAPATPIPVTARLNAGALTFPSTEGTYAYEAYTWNTDYVDRTVSSYRVGYPAGDSPEIRHFQGLPMPASGDCADVQDAAYAWGTGLKGGWTKAWEPWVNASAPEGQRGGWACTRTLVNRGGFTWVIE